MQTLVLCRIQAKSALQELVSVSGRRVDVADLVDLARSGDADAAPILRAAGYYAGIGLSIVVQTLNPERIVIGGGLLGAGSLLTTPMHAALREHCQPAMYETTRIVEWQLGDDIGILGGAALAFQHAARS